MTAYRIASYVLMTTWPLLLILAVVPWSGSRAKAAGPVASAPKQSREVTHNGTEEVVAALQRLIDGEAFGSTGRGEEGALEVQPPAESPSIPTLSLAGVVVGHTRIAIIDGLPGSQGGIALREGEMFGGIAVRLIEHERVLLSSGDTSWHVRLSGGEGKTP
jgi:hypothetical protein